MNQEINSHSPAFNTKSNLPRKNSFTSLISENQSELQSQKTTTAYAFSTKSQDIQNKLNFGMTNKRVDQVSNTKTQLENDRNSPFFPPNSFLRDNNNVNMNYDQSQNKNTMNINYEQNRKFFSLTYI